ncbi:putative patched domain-containing protein 3-like, partial [Triplophysa rosa]
MACYRTDCVEKPLGHLVGSHPVWCFIIPLMLSAALGGGLYFLKDCEDNDVENQFTPINGPSKQARLFVKERFPKNESKTEGNYAVMILSSVEGNILTKAAFEEIIRLDKKVSYFSSLSRQEEIEKRTDGIPLFSITYLRYLAYEKSLYRLCCVGGDYDKETGTEKQQPIMYFFKSYYGPFLIKPPCKACVILLYATYLAG